MTAFLTENEIADLIFDDATIVVEGFMGSANPDGILRRLEQRYLQTQHPKSLELWNVSGVATSPNDGINRLAHIGLLRRVVGGFYGPHTALTPLIKANEVEAYNYPQGVVSKMFRDIAAGQTVHLTKTGLNTFIDPELEGGKLNQRATADLIKKVQILDEEYLAFTLPRIDFAIVRVPFADELGNIALNEELLIEVQDIILASHNGGGKVLVEVDEIISHQALLQKVHRLPSALIDYVSVRQSLSEKSGRGQVVEQPRDQLRDLMASKALQILRNYDLTGRLINFGVGRYPEAVAKLAKHINALTSVESGVIGGEIQSGMLFGYAKNPLTVFSQPSMFDLYDGGGLDAAVLGFAEFDQAGNVNVSAFNHSISGAGGFIDIASNTRNIIFIGTMTAKGLKTSYEKGRVVIQQEGLVKKAVTMVEHITFSGERAYQNQQNVFFVTDRAIFKYNNQQRIEIIEIYGGIDLERDVLSQMNFVPDGVEKFRSASL